MKNDKKIKELESEILKLKKEDSDKEEIKIGDYKVEFHFWDAITLMKKKEQKYAYINEVVFPIEFWQSAKYVAEQTGVCIKIGTYYDCSLHLKTINKILDRLK